MTHGRSLSRLLSSRSFITVNTTVAHVHVDRIKRMWTRSDIKRANISSSDRSLPMWRTRLLGPGRSVPLACMLDSFPFILVFLDSRTNLRTICLLFSYSILLPPLLRTFFLLSNKQAHDTRTVCIPFLIRSTITPSSSSLTITSQPSIVHRHRHRHSKSVP